MPSLVSLVRVTCYLELCALQSFQQAGVPVGCSVVSQGRDARHHLMCHILIALIRCCFRYLQVRAGTQAVCIMALLTTLQCL